MFQQAWASASPKVGLPEKPWEELEVRSIALHMWEEHCVECAPPDCYSSCALFESRADLKCARFVNGIVRNDGVIGLEGAGFDIEFRRWAKLETKMPAYSRNLSPLAVRRMSWKLNLMESVARKFGHAFRHLDGRRRIQGAQYVWHQFLFPRWASSKQETRFDGFYIEIHSGEAARFTLEVVGKEGVMLRHGLNLIEGWNRSFIDQEQWPRFSSEGALVRLINNEDRNALITITALHLVNWQDGAKAVSSLTGTSIVDRTDGPKIKCVVFDLDNTLWKGVIGDDGPDGVVVNQEALQFIEALDARGIICAVASKNEFEIAWAKIESMGLGEHLLFPQIHWGPKSLSIKRIADDMNVNINTLAFIDDNPFERMEVQSACPDVRVFPESNLMTLLRREDFDVPVTEQASKRRLSYLAESIRKRNMGKLGGSVDEFLKGCNMQMVLLDPSEHRERCLEMIDRTNQFNISGRRYSQAEFDDLLQEDYHLCWSVKDDFGDYGIVGYLRAILQDGSWEIMDFVMSCRVAEKRVEEALFTWLMRNELDSGSPLKLRYVVTERNGAILNKLKELGVETEPGLVEFNPVLEGCDIIRVSSE